MKKRKIFAVLLSLCFLVVGGGTSLLTAGAEENELGMSISADSALEEANKEFQGTSNINFKKKEIYNLSFQQVGYVYDLESEQGENGYAIVCGTEKDGYQVEEYYACGENPFEKACLPIYNGLFSYFDIRENGLYDALNGEKITDLYCGVTTLTDSKEQDISYSRKSQRGKKIELGLPSYITYGNTENACSNIAAAIVLGYYDHFYPGLIPDYNSYENNAWTEENDQTVALIENLYHLMKTDVNGGTSFEDFKSGFTQYVNSKGNNVNYKEIASNSSINQSEMESAVDQGKPVVLFLNKYNVINMFFAHTGQDEIYTNYFSGSHTMVAYGYRNIDYYEIQTNNVWSPVWYNIFRFVTVKQEVKTRTDNYLNVKTIVPSAEDGYIRLYDNSNLEHALEIQIF